MAGTLPFSCLLSRPGWRWEAYSRCFEESRRQGGTACLITYDGLWAILLTLIYRRIFWKQSPGFLIHSVRSECGLHDTCFAVC
jgi:hypothetical protein